MSHSERFCRGQVVSVRDAWSGRWIAGLVLSIHGRFVHVAVPGAIRCVRASVVSPLRLVRSEAAS